jgi:ABC-2 type transport system ATP-binding protein
MTDIILQTHNLKKTFTVNKKSVYAVAGVDLTVRQGEIFGFLGPNGAGKTTTLRMLTTLLPIDDGEATVAGIDVRKNPNEVRKHIGYVSQEGGADGEATGLEDLVIQGRLYGMSATDAQKRAEEVIELLQLEQFADRKVKTYSGGQKRRLNIASGIIHKPDILFLDEPTTGLDPQNRANLWEQIRRLRDGGTTIFLTTHYLEEADALSNRLAIMDNGKIVASGTPHELKGKIAGDSIILQPRVAAGQFKAVCDYLGKQSFVKDAQREGDSIRLYVSDGTRALPKVISLLEAKDITLESVSVSQPSLDDVFLLQTGRSLRDTRKEEDNS